MADRTIHEMEDELSSLAKQPGFTKLLSESALRAASQGSKLRRECSIYEQGYANGCIDEAEWLSGYIEAEKAKIKPKGRRG
jgi:hypothetical protein